MGDLTHKIEEQVKHLNKAHTICQTIVDTLMDMESFPNICDHLGDISVEILQASLLLGTCHSELKSFDNKERK